MAREKKGPKVIFRSLEPRNAPSVITKSKIRSFLAANIASFSEVVYLGWVRREYKLDESTSKRGLRFIAATAPTRLKAREVMKKSTNWGEDVWDLT